MYNFVIPIKHNDLILNKKEHKRYLCELIDSIKNIQNKNPNDIIRIYVVCPGDYKINIEDINIINVNYPKPDQNLAQKNIKKYYQQFRVDKGSKINQVYEIINKDEWIIPLDDDDLISKNYLDEIKKIKKDMFVIEYGYKWYPIKRILQKETNIDKFCGTTIGFKKRLLEKYKNKKDFVEIIGSHSYIKKYEHDYEKIRKFIVLWRLENLNSSQELLWKKKTLIKKIKKLVLTFIQSTKSKSLKGKNYQKIIERDFK